MKKRLLCLVLAICAFACLQTAVLAAEGEETEMEKTHRIFAEKSDAYDGNGNLLLDTPGEFMQIQAVFIDKSDAQMAWAVLSGKEVVSLVQHASYTDVAVLTALADGEATIVAYLEDDSQASVVAKVVVRNQVVGATPNVSLHTSVEGDGNISRKTETGGSVSLGTKYEDWHPVGMVVDLTAVEKNNKFKHWLARRGTDEKVIVSTDLNYTFILSGDTTVVAVFDQTVTKKGENAMFLHNNVVLSDTYISMSRKEPAALYQRNMEFVKWISSQVDADAVLENKKVDKGEITQATTFMATYQKKPSAFTINVIGGSGSGTYAYGDAVVAKVTDAAQDGKQFLFWSKDGAPVSYDATYAFSAMQDCNVTAVFGAAVETDGINMVMQRPVEDGNVIAFTFERYVPENYHFISSGLVVGNSKDCKLGDKDSTGKSANYMEAVSYRDGTRTQFTKSLTKISGVKTYYARGYVIYKDGDALKTVYTPAQKIVIE